MREVPAPDPPSDPRPASLPTGRALDYLKAGNDRRKLCGLYLSIMDRMGLELPAFGDARERLAGI